MPKITVKKYLLDDVEKVRQSLRAAEKSYDEAWGCGGQPSQLDGEMDAAVVDGAEEDG